ncbi:MAG: UDP-N-acetylglucosamine--N-acetylmuramyl-(pentapeptide) pyrophosphoryl-undecaprenol N-acetylglucosamine transferase [Pseudomonadota bacterium]
MSPLLVIAAGGTGGHMFPAQALAEEMLSRGWRVHLSTDDRGARYAGGFPEAVSRQVVSAGTFARGGLSTLKAPVQIVAGIVTALWRTWRERPAVVAGFGGYPALPAMAAAWLLGRPRLIHEANGVLGRVNELFALRVSTVACGVWPTELPAGAQAAHTGNPVRAAIASQAAAPYISPGDGPLHLVVIGGSQGASILSQTVPAALAQLPDGVRTRLHVAHQARPADHDAVVATYRGAGIEAIVQPFFSDVPERLAAAQLVISRSGASSVADIAAVGRPSILIPLAIAKRDEQTANARGLTEAGAALSMPERTLSPEGLARAVEDIITDPDRATTMAGAARTLGRPDAARTLADLVESLGKTADA